MCSLGFAQLPFAGMFGLVEYQRSATGYNPRLSKSLLLSVLLPAGAVALFGTLFVLANPDLVKSVVRNADQLLRRLAEWIEGLSQNWREVAFWLAVAYLAIGLLRPAHQAVDHRPQSGLPVCSRCRNRRADGRSAALWPDSQHALGGDRPVRRLSRV